MVDTVVESTPNADATKPKGQDYLSGLVDEGRIQRSKFTPQWYINVNAYENNHFLVWLPKAKKIGKVPLRSGGFFNQVPEVKNQVDTIQNLLLSTQVVPVVYPVYFDKVSVYWASKISDFLLDLYDRWYFNGVLHDAVHDALVMPVSFLQLIPPDDNFGDMGIRELDAFDVITPPGIKDVQSDECKWVAISARQNVEDIKKNPIYTNTKDIVPDSRFSSVDYKNQIMTDRFNEADQSKKGTAVVDEVYIKERQEDNKVLIRIRTYCQGKRIRNELTKWERIPIVSLKLHQGTLYQPSFTEYILPMNRSVDLLMSRIEDSAIRNTRDFLLSPYGASIERVKDENGDIMEYRGTQKPEYLTRPDFPKDILAYVNMNFSLIERTGASAMTMGASPKGSKAYRSQEAQRQQDYAQQKTPSDFMKIALTQLFNLVIYFASQYYLEPHDVKIYQRENFDAFQILGENGIKHNMDKFTDNAGDMKAAPVVIHPKNLVKIEFESALSYTMEGKRQTIFQAFQLGLISKEDAIRMLAFGNTRDIMENLLKEQEQKMGQDITKARAMQTANAQAAQNVSGNSGNQAPSVAPAGANNPNAQPQQGQQPPAPPPPGGQPQQGGGGQQMSPQQMQQIAQASMEQARQGQPGANGKKPIRLPGIRVGQ